MKPTEFITIEKPFFDPGAGTSHTCTVGVSDVSVTSPSLVQATGEVAVIKATRPVEAPGTRRGDVTQKNATQPVEAPGAGPEVLVSGTGSDTAQLDQSLTGGNLPDVTGGSESEEDMQTEPNSPILATSGMAPQTGMTRLNRTSLKKPIKERLSEGSDHSWAGTRFLISTVLHLP